MKPEVTASLPASSAERRSPLPGLSFSLPPSKFGPPAERPGVVTRAALVDRLAAADVPFITVVAPPGYGKTTLLAQWAGRLAPGVAWVSCDDADNDPVVLFSALAAALDRIEPVEPAIFWALASSGAGITVVPRLVSAIASMPPPVTLVLDHAEAVTNKRVPGHASPNSPCASRRAGSSPWPRAAACRCRRPGCALRARSWRSPPHDLAMDPAEASSLLEGAGIEPGAASVPELLQRTEGWPAGLYLAALAMKAGLGPGEVGSAFTGDDRFMGDYLRSELLSHVSAAEVSFLTRTSVLDRMCGPLCDAILRREGFREPCSRGWRPGTCWWSRSTGAASGTATTTCSGSCCWPSSGGASPTWSRTCTSGPRPGTRRTRCRRRRSSTPRRRATTTGWPAWSSSWQQPVWASGRVETVLRWMEWLRDMTAGRALSARSPCTAR